MADMGPLLQMGSIGIRAAGAEQEATRFRQQGDEERQKLMDLLLSMKGPSTPVPEARSPMSTLLGSLMSNTASAVSGNPDFMRGNMGAMAEETRVRTEAQTKAAEMSAQDLREKRAGLLTMKLANLSQLYEAAQSAGNFAKQAELVDEQLKVTKELAKEREAGDTSRAHERVQADRDIAAVHDKAMLEAHRIAAESRGTTGNPFLDALGARQDMRTAIAGQLSAAIKATKSKDEADLVKKNPMYQYLLDSRKQVDLFPMADKAGKPVESAEVYVMRNGAVGNTREELESYGAKAFKPEELKAALDKHYKLSGTARASGRATTPAALIMKMGLKAPGAILRGAGQALPEELRVDDLFKLWGEMFSPATADTTR